eukprot:gene2734-1719_t
MYCCHCAGTVWIGTCGEVYCSSRCEAFVNVVDCPFRVASGVWWCLPGLLDAILMVLPILVSCSVWSLFKAMVNLGTVGSGCVELRVGTLLGNCVPLCAGLYVVFIYASDYFRVGFFDIWYFVSFWICHLEAWLVAGILYSELLAYMGEHPVFVLVAMFWVNLIVANNYEVIVLLVRWVGSLYAGFFGVGVAIVYFGCMYIVQTLGLPLPGEWVVAFVLVRWCALGFYFEFDWAGVSGLCGSKTTPVFDLMDSRGSCVCVARIMEATFRGFVGLGLNVTLRVVGLLGEFCFALIDAWCCGRVSHAVGGCDCGVFVDLGSPRLAEVRTGVLEFLGRLHAYLVEFITCGLCYFGIDFRLRMVVAFVVLNFVFYRGCMLQVCVVRVGVNCKALSYLVLEVLSRFVNAVEVGIVPHDLSFMCTLCYSWQIHFDISGWLFKCVKFELRMLCEFRCWCWIWAVCEFSDANVFMVLDHACDTLILFSDTALLYCGGLLPDCMLAWGSVYKNCLLWVVCKAFVCLIVVANLFAVFGMPFGPLILTKCVLYRNFRYAAMMDGFLGLRHTEFLLGLVYAIVAIYQQFCCLLVTGGVWVLKLASCVVAYVSLVLLELIGSGRNCTADGFVEVVCKALLRCDIIMTDRTFYGGVLAASVISLPYGRSAAYFVVLAASCQGLLLTCVVVDAVKVFIGMIERLAVYCICLYYAALLYMVFMMGAYSLSVLPLCCCDATCDATVVVNDFTLTKSFMVVNGFVLLWLEFLFFSGFDWFCYGGYELLGYVVW